MDKEELKELHQQAQESIKKKKPKSKSSNYFRFIIIIQFLLLFIVCGLLFFSYTKYGKKVFQGSIFETLFKSH